MLYLAAGSGVWGVALTEQSPQVQINAVDWLPVLAVTEKLHGDIVPAIGWPLGRATSAENPMNQSIAGLRGGGLALLTLALGATMMMERT